MNKGSDRVSMWLMIAGTMNPGGIGVDPPGLRRA